MSQFQEQLESIPGYDIAMDYFNDYAGEHFNSINPFEDKDGNKRRLPPDITSKEEQKLWKKIQSRAWIHDKCFVGSCGVGLDCGVGIAPIVVLIPVLGPIFMYAVHTRLLSIAQEKIVFPNKFVAKVHSLIILDLLLTLPPVIGSFFSWMYGCSTKSAGLIYNYMVFVADERAKHTQSTYLGSSTIRREPVAKVPPQNLSSTDKRTEQSSKLNKQTRRQNQKNQRPTNHNEIVVGTQQQSGFV